MACDCITCRHSRGEITTEECIWGLKNRLEVWEIVSNYFNLDGNINSESLHNLEMNVSCAIEEISIILDELENKKGG